MAKQTFTAGQTLTAQQMSDLQTNDFNMSVSTQTANYTLQAADKGTREVMNMGSAGTVTVPNSTFNAGDAVWVHSIGSGSRLFLHEQLGNIFSRWRHNLRCSNRRNLVEHYRRRSGVHASHLLL